jgi:hypothetical protein
MSKRELKKYIASLTKEQMAEQFTMLYDKFKEVKAYYDFVFNPREDRMADEAKAKIANEYFPVKSKRARLRRTVAQKYIRHFLTLGVDPFVVADVMLFTIETAQQYSAKRTIRFDSFYKSILKSFEQAIQYTISNGIAADFRERLFRVADAANHQRWANRQEFTQALSPFGED